MIIRLINCYFLWCDFRELLNIKRVDTGLIECIFKKLPLVFHKRSLACPETFIVDKSKWIIIHIIIYPPDCVPFIDRKITRIKVSSQSIRSIIPKSPYLVKTIIAIYPRSILNWRCRIRLYFLVSDWKQALSEKGWVKELEFPTQPKKIDVRRISIIIQIIYIPAPH